MPARIDITGQRFNRLTVLSFHDTRTGNARWRCRCDCGNETIALACNLKKGNSQSCGCFKDHVIESNRRLKTKHGENRRTPEWSVWQSMRARCLNPNTISYPNYGARGIKVCGRWKDYASFLADMGRRPSPKHSLDRIDNDGPYSPENCRWATWKEQAANRRRHQPTDTV